MGHSFKLIGAPCAHRGPYTFYKAFKYTKNNITNILTINEFFFVKLWNDSDLISIGELRLLWEDKTYDCALASLRLYILPENTPDGRINDIHGEDEVLAITEKVVIKLDDLLTWITEASDWNWGLGAVWRQQCSLVNDRNIKLVETNEKVNDMIDVNGENDNINFCDDRISTLVDCFALDYSDVHKEKRQLDVKNWETRTGVLVLSYSRYCRYRGLLKRLEGVHNDWLRNKLVSALGGFTTTCRTTKILFCKDTFDYPDLEGHELLCNHLAPKLRSRIPKKKKVLYPSPDISESDSSSDYVSEDEIEDERLFSSASSSTSTNSRSKNVVSRSFCSERKPDNQRSLPVNVSSVSVRHVHSAAPEDQRKQKAFIQNLYSFMKARLTPIGRLPHIGNKEINLFEFYNKVKHLGGHSSVTSNKLWKYVFEELGGERGNFSASATAREHYEKFLLPYEQHIVQQFKNSNNQLSIKPQFQCSSSNEKESAVRLQTDKKRSQQQQQIGLTKVVISESRTTTISFCTEPGDKENIPLSEKKLGPLPEVIDLCGPDEEQSSRTIQQTASSSVPEVIDLCGESPIKRSVPSINATLLPRKRKLDILKEGGLEVTPISTNASTNNYLRDVVTIIRKVSVSSSDRVVKKSLEGSDDEQMSVEILDPKKYSCDSPSNDDSSSEIILSGASSKTISQVLDLRTIRNEKTPLSGDNFIKKFSPNLGPNIEISLVPNDCDKRSEKKRRSTHLPIPALRKISSGELTITDLNMKDKYKPEVTIATTTTSKKTEINASANNAPKPDLSIGSCVEETSPTLSNVDKDKSSVLPAFVSNVNPSIYLAALYESIFPMSAAATEFLDIQSQPEDDRSVSSPHQVQLSQQQLNYLNGAILQQQSQQHQQQQMQQFSEKGMTASDAFAFAQKFSNILKNNTVSIVENYEKILPD